MSSPARQQAGEAAGVAFISFEGSTGLFGDEGRSGDQAGHVELFEASSDAEAAGAGLVGDLERGAVVSFADTAQGFFQGVEVVGDGAEEAELALGTALGRIDSRLNVTGGGRPSGLG